MKRYVLLFIFAVAFASSKAQYNKNNSGDQSSIMDKLYFSGGGGLGGGTSPNGYKYFYYSILPTVGYRVTPEFMVGLNLMYTKYSYSDLGISYEQLGYAPFARYYFEQFFVQVEYDRISSTALDNRPRQFYDRFLLGAGYVQPVGRRSAINAMAMYDVLYQQNGVFSSPWVVRVFFSF
jgi:hypothetical protein